MINNKQTLIEQFVIECGNYGDTAQIPDEVIEKFKEMDKAQIAEAFTKGNRLDVYDGTETSGQQYYNETYGGNK
jgi:hypothetical protein